MTFVKRQTDGTAVGQKLLAYTVCCLGNYYRKTEVGENVSKLFNLASVANKRQVVELLIAC